MESFRTSPPVRLLENFRKKVTSPRNNIYCSRSTCSWLIINDYNDEEVGDKSKYSRIKKYNERSIIIGPFLRLFSILTSTSINTNKNISQITKQKHKKKEKHEHKETDTNIKMIWGYVRNMPLTSINLSVSDTGRVRPRVGSGRVGSGRAGSGWVRVWPGRVGSGQNVAGSGRVRPQKNLLISNFTWDKQQF